MSCNTTGNIKYKLTGNETMKHNKFIKGINTSKEAEKQTKMKQSQGFLVCVSLMEIF